jgi:hypothetical protein
MRSFDHVVGASQQRRRHIEAECLRGLRVDGEFELGRKLDRQIGGFGAPEDAIDIGRRAPLQIDGVDSAGDQAARGDHLPTGIDRRQTGIAVHRLDNRHRQAGRAAFPVHLVNK